MRDYPPEYSLPLAHWPADRLLACQVPFMLRNPNLILFIPQFELKGKSNARNTSNMGSSHWQVMKYGAWERCQLQLLIDNLLGSIIIYNRFIFIFIKFLKQMFQLPKMDFKRWKVFHIFSVRNPQIQLCYRHQS